jgi:integrase
MNPGKHGKGRGSKTVRDIGRAEPGFDIFERFYRRGGSTDEAIVQYSEKLGTVRGLAGKPLLKLTEDELETLDLELLKRAKVYRTVLRMFFKANRRSDLRDSMPRQRRAAERRLGLNDILTPTDVMTLIASTGSLRDGALIATLAATGGRINEVLSLRLKDIKQSNGSAYQMWFGSTKVKGAERYSHKVEGEFKKHLDAYLEAHPYRGNPDAPLFVSTAHEDMAVTDGTIGTLLASLAKKAGIAKPVNPHAFRHARYTWGIINGEDQAKLNTCQWGSPVSMQAKRYSHFTGLDARLEEAKPIEMRAVPVLPTPPVLSTQARVAELQARIEQMERDREKLASEAVKVATEKVAEFFRAGLTKAGIEVHDRPLTSEEMAQKAVSVFVSEEKK